MEQIKKFNEALNLNVSDKAEKKNNLTYLSWAWAWGEFKKIYPDAVYRIIKNDNNMPYFADETGGIVYTEVSAGGLTYEMWLPIMDYKNRSMKEFTTFDVNKTIMRCLTKNLAMFGLGLYIYAGEDLPEQEAEKTENKKGKKSLDASETNKTYIRLIEQQMEKLEDKEAFLKWLEETYKTTDLYLLDTLQLVKINKLLGKKNETTTD